MCMIYFRKENQAENKFRDDNDWCNFNTRLDDVSITEDIDIL